MSAPALRCAKGLHDIDYPAQACPVCRGNTAPAQWAPRPERVLAAVPPPPKPVAPPVRAVAYVPTVPIERTDEPSSFVAPPPFIDAPRERPPCVACRRPMRAGAWHNFVALRPLCPLCRVAFVADELTLAAVEAWTAKRGAK